jgi:signal transduction histidine kinase
VKFSPENSGRAVLSLRRIGGEYQLSVSDNGPGIRPADRQIVFERFRQLGGSMGNKPQGVGLGLPISQRIATQHGGRIIIDDAPGGGAVFTLLLPAAKAAAPAARRPERVS